MSHVDALHQRITKMLADIKLQREQAALPDISELEKAWMRESCERKLEVFMNEGLTTEERCLAVLEINLDIDSRKTPAERAVEQRRNAQSHYSCIGAREQLEQRLGQIRISSEGTIA
jgi:hypothetical protein